MSAPEVWTRPLPGQGIVGAFFWAMPAGHRSQRIRKLREQRLSDETVAMLTRTHRAGQR